MGNTVLFNTAGSIALAINYEIQGPYNDKFMTKQAAKTLRINSEFYCRVDDIIFCIDTDVDLTESDLDTGESFDASETYYVYACYPLSGSDPVFKISKNATYPSGGWDADNSRKIGGFDTDGDGYISESTIWDLRTVDVTTTGVEDNDIPANEISLSKLKDGTAGAFLRRNLSGVTVEDAAVTLQNIFTNSGLGVWSNSDTNKGLGSLTYDNKSGTFQVGETVTGGTSGAVGKIIADSGTVLTLGACAGRFHDDEQITGGTSGATADVNMPNSAPGVDKLQNGEFSVDTDPPPGWTPGTGATLTTEGSGQVGNCMMVQCDGVGNRYGYQSRTVEIGKIYRFEGYAKKGTSATGFIRLGTAENGSQYAAITSEDAAWTKYTFTFEATSTNFFITLRCQDANSTFYFDECSFYEITPCCTEEDVLGLDGWIKDTTLDIYRQHNDSTYTKDGAFYSVKSVKGSNTWEALEWPLSGIRAKEEWYQRFAGRTITFGVWVYSVAVADNVKLMLWDGSTSTYSSFASADTWEWLEVTVTISANPTGFKASIGFDGDIGDIVYISQPILVFGSFIGEGNYNTPFQEVIRFEKDIVLTDYDFGTGDISADVDAAINIEAQSEGKIPKGISEIYANIRAMDSAVAADIGVWMGPDTTYCAQGIGDVGLELQGLGNDIKGQAGGWVRCNNEGDPWLFLNASGSGTLDCEIRVQRVRLR